MISGSLLVSTAEIALSTGEPFVSPEMMQDDKRRAFSKALIDIDLDGKKHVELLEPKQVQLMLRVLRVVL